MKIEIFGKELCSFCADAKALLDRKSIAYTYVDFFKLSSEEQEEVRTRAPNAATFPIIFLEETYIGGFKQLESAFK